MKLKNLFIFTFTWINEPTDNCIHVSKWIQTRMSTVCTSYHLVSLFLLFVEKKSLSHVQFFVTPWDCSPPGSSVHGIFLARYWSGLSFPVSGDLPDPGIKPIFLVSLALTGRFFTTEPPGKTKEVHMDYLIISLKDGKRSG